MKINEKEKSEYKTFEYKNYLIKTREHKGKYTGGIYDIQDTIQHPVDAIYAHHWEDSERVLEAKLLDYVDKEKKKESSILTLTYGYFTSKVYWDDSNCWWYICHIFNSQKLHFKTNKEEKLMLFLFTSTIQDFDLDVYEDEDGVFAGICRENNFYSRDFSTSNLKKEFKEFVDRKLAEQNRIKNLEKKLEELVEEVANLKWKLGDRD